MSRKVLIGIFFIAVLVGWGSWWRTPQDKLLIAPVIGGLDSCIFKRKELLENEPNEPFTKLCMQSDSSPSAVINATIKTFVDRKFSEGDYRFGYTLYVPLLKLFRLDDQKNFVINPEFVQRVANTVRDVKRPMVLYLFSDHFGIDSPFEEMLAKNPENILQTKKGALPLDTYGPVELFPWSFVNTENQLTQLRAKAMNAVLDEVCKMPKKVQQRVEAVTILGESHHLYPKFETGMGYDAEYLITDYSPVSVKGFNKYLTEKFSDIQALNTYLGSKFTKFEEVTPPSKDIRKESMRHFWEHIDPYAHGVLPVSGWVARVQSKRPQTVHLYLNGEFLAKIPVKQGRQDVLDAFPLIGSPDVGWSYDLDFQKLPEGIHQIDVFVDDAAGGLTRLASRKWVHVGMTQAAPPTMPMKALPEFKTATAKMSFMVDHPRDLSSYYFNPLVVLWHDFRKSQVTAYLKYFETIAKSKCIPAERVYSHQILPFVNPGWDVTKFAVGQDLAVPETLNLGVSLYGEATYGTSFFEWFTQTRRKSYGVTEFHPLKAMNAKDLGAVFAKHKAHNAKFISFFADAEGLHRDTPVNAAADADDAGGATASTNFIFSKRNHSIGSSTLFESVREILR